MSTNRSDSKTNPTIRKRELAVALSYDGKTDVAPKVVASGRGIIAEKILEQAKEFGIPIRQDPETAQLLAGLALGDTIPQELFPVIAEILAFVYSLDKNTAKIEK